MRFKDAVGAPLQAAWTGVAVVGFVGIATASAWPIYGIDRLAMVAASALAVGALLAVAALLLRWRWWITAPVALLAYAVIAVPVAMPSALDDPRRTVRGVADAVTGIVTSWKRLATVSLPAGDYQAVLLPFFLTVTVCTLVSLLIALGGGAKAPWAVAPSLVMVVFGPAFGTPEPGDSFSIGPVTIPAARHVVIALAAVGWALLWLIVRARIDRAAALKAARSRASTVRQRGASLAMVARRQVLAAAIAIAALGAAVAVAPVSDALGHRRAVRDAVDPVLVLAAQPSPLSSYRAYFAGDAFDAPLFTVADTQGVDRLRIATLDSYDGVTFHVADAGPSAQFSREPGKQHGDMLVTIGAGYSGLWVPLASAEGGAPRFQGKRASDLADAYFGSSALDAGVVVTDGAERGIGLVEGDAYRIAAPQAPVDDAAFLSASGGDPLVLADDMPKLAAWVDAQELGRTGADVMELIDRLRTRGYLSHSVSDGPAAAAWQNALPGYSFEPSRAGHSLARVDALFSDLLDQQLRSGDGADQASLVAAVGDDEQFATAAALLARYLGFDARVVIGVLIGQSPEGSPVDACDKTCTGANVTVWAEVRTPQGQWLPIDASPQYQDQPIRIREGENPPKNPTEALLPQTDVIEPPSTQNDNAVTSSSTTAPTDKQARSLPRVVVLAATGALASGLVALPFTIFPLAKAGRRRWRRGAAAPEVALVGAWSELLDAYRDFGIDVPGRLTRGETADLLDRAAALELAWIVDKAVFAEHPPTREMSQWAWELVDAERKELAHEASVGRRLKAVFTFSSLRPSLTAEHTAHLSTHSIERTAHASR